MYYFSARKLTQILAIVGRMPSTSGVHFVVSERAVRPKLWTLYEKEIPNYYTGNCRFQSDRVDYDADDAVDSEVDDVTETN